jgi:hypothetical protein
MKLPAALTVKPLLYVVGVLVLTVAGMAVALALKSADSRAAAATADGLLTSCSASRDGAVIRVQELVKANAGYGETVAALRSELRLAQQQAVTLRVQSEAALAAAEAREADANLTLAQFMNRYASQARETRCALALTEMEASCPAFSGY